MSKSRKDCMHYGSCLFSNAEECSESCPYYELSRIDDLDEFDTGSHLRSLERESEEYN
jgi:hypothetical protein